LTRSAPGEIIGDNPGPFGETAMASVNKVILIGNLGRDPELRYTKDGKAVANFTLATNDRWRDREGNSQERTEWHRIVVWDKQAENCAQYLQKGRSVYIEGRLQTREWEDKEGQKRQTTEIVAQQVTFLGSRDAGSRSASAPTPPGPEPAPAEGDDIPF
jgi:single-strand DNA-binding protein